MSEPAATGRRRESDLGRRVLIVALTAVFGPVVVILLAGGAPKIVGWGSVLVLALGIVGIARPSPRYMMPSRMRAAAAVWLGIVGAVAGLSQETDADLAALKAADPLKYLEAIQKKRTDAEWLAELKDIDPARHAVEVSRREEAARLAAEKAAQEAAARREKAAAEREAAEREKARLFGERLSRELADLSSFKVGDYAGSKEAVTIAVAQFSAWASLVEEGNRLALSNEDDSNLKKLKKELARMQKGAFPALRKAYVNALKTALWEHDISVRGFGDGNATVEFVAGAFAANRNIKDFNDGIWNGLTTMRFKKAQYRWYEGADKYTSYTVDSRSDADIVVYYGDGSYRIVK